MDNDDFGEPTWPARLARGCFWLAILGAAVWWLASRERPVPARQRVAVLRDPRQRPSARHIAADHLQHADASVVPELIKTLNAGDALGRELAALALGRLGAKAGAAADALTKAADDPEASVREQAIVALGRMAQARELAELLADDDAEVRRRAVIELGQMEIDAEPFAKVLRKTLADTDAHVRAEAYAALWKLSAVNISDLTTGMRSDPDPLVRRTTVILLARLPDAAAETLLPALNDRDSLVRTAALEELGNMRAAAEPAVVAIAAQLESPDEKTVQAAAVALGKIGPSASTATEALIEQYSVSPWARAALRRIGRESELPPPRLFQALHAEGDTAQSLMLSDLITERGVYAITDADMQHVKRLKHLRLLCLANNPVGDAGLAEIADLKELRRLELGRTKVTSQGLRHLAGLINLRTLSLRYCSITDEGLAELANLRSLEELFLDDTLVTDAGMPHLANLSKLKWISLWGTKVTDAGLAHLKGIESLEEVVFPEQVSLAGLVQIPGLTRIMRVPKSTTDTDLESLAALKRLKTLALSHCSITDTGMVAVSKLALLESLYLDNIPITGAGLEQLRSLTNLRSLSLGRVTVSQQAAYALKQSLPELTIGPSIDVASTPPLDYQVVGLKDVVGLTSVVVAR